MIIYGTRFFGKVDAVPGLGHVATRWFHIDYFPLVPTQGWLLMTKTGNKWSGVRIPISFKSILVAWCRIAAMVIIACGVIALIMQLSHNRIDPETITGGIVLAIVGTGLLIVLYKAPIVTRASYARACQLARLAKLNDAGLLALAQAYGQPPVSYGFTPAMSERAVESANDKLRAKPATAPVMPTQVLALTPEAPPPAAARESDSQVIGLQ